jgi:hypothetical protein
MVGGIGATIVISDVGGRDSDGGASEILSMTDDELVMLEEITNKE